MLVAGLLGMVPAMAGPVISEFMARNVSVLADEDGEFADWIEIHNPTAAAINLGGWHLTDRAHDPVQWAFPPVTLAAGGHMVVFASGKNRRHPDQPLHTNFSLAADGEYLALIAPDGVTVATEFAPAYPPQLADVSYGSSAPDAWVRLAGKGDPVRVHVPTESTGPALGTAWRERVFNDAGWQAGTLAVGFKNGTNDPEGMRAIFETNVQSQMFNLPNRLSVYLRVPFSVPNPADVRRLELRTQFDDGYASFLNGGSVPVDQRNAPSPLAWNSAATAIVFDGEGLPVRVADLTNQRDRLVAGTNILAVHGLNANQTSSDLLIAPQVWALLPTAGTPLTGYFFHPTPGAPNPGQDSLMLAEAVEFSPPPRGFANSLSVSASGAGPGQLIRYTTDGSVPTASSPILGGSLSLTATTLLRARVFGADGIGGRTASAHYLRLSSALASRRSNLPMVVLDARGQTLNDSVRTPAYFHLFDRDQSGVSDLSRVSDVATRQGLRFRGSSSLSFPKKPYSAEFWDDFDDERRLNVLGMGAEADWVFYAPYDFDRAYTRNSIAYEMSRRMGRWAPQTRFVEVFYNANGGTLAESDYVGVYAIVEQVKLNTRRLGHRIVTPADVPPAGPIDPLASGPWTGGYLFKIDRTDADEANWWTTRGIPGGSWLTLNRPKMPNLDGGPYFSNDAAFAGSRQLNYLRDYVQAFEDALVGDRATGFATRHYRRFIEVDAWVDHLIINVFTKNVDALRLSAFFHKPEDKKLHAGPVWDFDRSMDSYDSRDNDPRTWTGTGDATQYFNYAWWQWLCEDPDFVQAFHDRWAALRRGVLSDAGLDDIILPFGAEIHNSANSLGSAAVRDATRWSRNAPRNGNYHDETLHLLNWMKVRGNWMDRRRLNGNLLPAPPVVAESGGHAILSGSGTLVYTLDGSDPRGPGGTVAGLANSGPIPIDGPTMLTVRALFGGVWSTPTTAAFNLRVPGPVFLPGRTAAWAVNSHWDSNPAPYPHGPAAAATIHPPLGGNRHVDLTVPLTVGRIAFPQADSADRNRLRGQEPGHRLTFDHAGEPARVDVGGHGGGFVEFDVAAGCVLADTLVLDVTNPAGDPVHGALRLRQAWSGPGGLTKLGPGVASLTGDDKLYRGPTLVQNGVLQVTGSSVMTASESLTVLPGAQLRLVSESAAPGVPRVHSFGGGLFLSGSGRGDEVPDGGGFGRLGALRYQPPGQDNHAVVTNDVNMAADGSIHVNGSRNRLDLTGTLGGPGLLEKSGGGTLGILSLSPAHAAPIHVANGGLRLRGSVASAITLAAAAVLDGAGHAGVIDGPGTLVLPATTLAAPQVGALHHAFLFTRPGPPHPADPAASGNALLVTADAATPLGLDFYLDLAAPIEPSTTVQGGLLLPATAAWSDLLDHPAARVFVADPAGPHSFNGATWTLHAGARLTSMPITLATADGTLAGRILEIRFADDPLAYDAWRGVVFDPAAAADLAVSGPEAAPFGDGLANLLRFALGIDVGSNAGGRLPTLTLDGGRAVFRFPYDPGLRGLRWQVESAADPGDFSAAEILFDSRHDLALPGLDGWLAVERAPADARRFFRLRVTADSDR